MSDYLLETKHQEKQGNEWVTVEHNVELVNQTHLHNVVCCTI